MIMRCLHVFVTIIILGSFTACKNNHEDQAEPETIPVIGYTFLRSFPHDTASFTEGLLIHDRILYESTGSFGQSSYLRSVFGPVDRLTGKIDIKVELDRNTYCGEGICYLKGKYYQLTYTNQVGFVYDALTFLKKDEFSFQSSQGWGLTTDGKSLIMSDGTDKLTFLDPETYLVKGVISVTWNGTAEKYLNELEFIGGYVYANVWLTNTIVKIDPSTGKIHGILDLTALAKEAENEYPGSMEMNGIAYDYVSGNIKITGKLWPRVYEIRLTGISNSTDLPVSHTGSENDIISPAGPPLRTLATRSPFTRHRINGL